MVPTIPVQAPDWPLLVAAARASLHGIVHRWLIHELRNPVQALTLVPELMSIDGDSPVVRQMLEEGTATLARTFDLLDRTMRAPAAYGSPAEPTVLRDVLDYLAQLTAARRGAPPAVRVADASALPAVRAVEDDLVQVLLTFVVQGIRDAGEAPEGAVEVTATLEGDAVVLGVLTRGPGASVGAAEAAFALRGEGEEATFAVAAHLVRAMDGQLAVEGAPGGVRYVVRLRRW